MSSRVIVLGGTLAGVRAARRLAEAGLTVTLLESSPFLGRDLPRRSATWMPAIPDLLEVTRDRRITVLTQATVETMNRQEGGFHLLVEQAPRYVDPARCTACGECETVCPVEPMHGQDGHRRKAIYRDPPARAVPNIYAIEKRGVPPCTHTCPGGIHVQGYVALIAQGKFRQAHDLIARAIPFPGICGRVCHHPCESECSRKELDEPIAVRALKRFVADYIAGRDGLHWEQPVPDPSLPPVAVIGAGPAGLTVAWELARQGARVTVFEALPVAGGMMAVGIPAYRLPREVLDREIAAIEALGVELRLNTPLGADLTLDDLFAQGYGAVFLGLGAHRSRRLGVPGEDLAGVLHAIDLLRAVSLLQQDGGEGDLPTRLRQDCGFEIGRRAVVVGGGNSAVDVARTLVRLGVEDVCILYRRSRREMPAIPEEIAATEEEGITLEILTAPVQILGQNGHVAGLECVRMELGEPDESGRRRPIPIPESTFTVDADMVLLAIGQQPDLPLLPAELCDESGWLCVDPATGRTPLPGVFAAGDVVRPASVIEAVGAAKRAAAAILRYLRGEQEVPLPPERPVARWSAEELEERVEQARREPPVLPPHQRVHDFAEVEQAFTTEQAVIEASRCLACAVCSECLECLTVCQPQAIDHHARPRRLTLVADTVLLAGGYDVPLLQGMYQLDGDSPEVAVEALLSTLPGLERRLAPARQRVLSALPSPPRLGVFLCHCGDQIAGALDMDALQERVTGLPGVVRVEQVPFACLPEGVAAVRQATAELDGAVLAACSCCGLAQICYSCTTQRVRCRSGLGVWETEAESIPPPWAWEYVNLREQCAWIYGPTAALEAATDYVAAAVTRLLTGPAVPLVATVDPARCRACGTCETLCQAEAIHLEVGEGGRVWAHVEEERCRACGTCAAHCPTGAVVAGRVSDRQLETTIEALLHSGRKAGVLVFTCNWGGHSGAETAGMYHHTLPVQVRTVRVPCLGRLSPALLLHALEQGAAGVLLAGCTEDGCRYEFGRELAVQALAQARELADLLGRGAERLEMVEIPPGGGRAFVRAVDEFVAQVGGQGSPSQV